MSINLTDEIEVKTKKGKLGAAKQIFLEGDTQTVEKEIQDINSRHNSLNTKHESLSRTVQGIAVTGGANTATNVTYNNDASGLNAENAQDAIDEVSRYVGKDCPIKIGFNFTNDKESLIATDNRSVIENIRESFYLKLKEGYTIGNIHQKNYDGTYDTIFSGASEITFVKGLYKSVSLVIIGNTSNVAKTDIIDTYDEGLIFHISENKKRIDETQAKVVTDIVDSNEWLEAKVDNKNNVLEGVSETGTKIVNIPIVFNSDVECTKNIVRNEEWIWAILDNKGSVLMGLKEDGSFEYAIGVPENIQKELRKLTTNKINRFFGSSANNTIIGNDSVIVNGLGVNFHFSVDMQKDIAAYLISDAINMGITLCRGGSCDCAYKLYEKGVTLIGSCHSIRENISSEYPNYPSGVSNFEESFSKWKEGLKKLLKKFDGNIRDISDPLCIQIDGIPVGMKIVYWEGFNELDLNYERYNLNNEQLFRIIRDTYLIVKEERPDAIVLNGGWAGVTEKLKEISSIEDEDGNRWWNFVDILNIHYYAKNPSNLLDETLRLKSLLKQYDNKEDATLKPIWLTEFGNDTYNYSEQLQAMNIAKWFLTAFACGYGRASFYEYMSSESNNNSITKENYFGLVHRSINNSYGSFLKKDEKTAISDGEALSKVYITNGEFFVLVVDDMILRNINNHGLSIGGEGYAITKVVKVNNVEDIQEIGETIYEGYTEISNNSVLDLDDEAILQANLADGNCIKVYVNNVKNLQYKQAVFPSHLDVALGTDSWLGLDKKPAYDAFLAFSKFFKNGSTTPSMNIFKDIYIFNWLQPNGRSCFALYSDNKSVSVKITKDSRMGIYDYLGNVIEDEILSINQNVIYITNTSVLEFEFV